MRSLLAFALVVCSACWNVGFANISNEDLLLATGLRITYPANNSVVPTFGLHLELEATDTFGLRVPVPHGRLCWQMLNPDDSVGAESCFREDAWLLGAIGADVTPAASTGFADGLYRLRLVLLPSQGGRFTYVELDEADIALNTHTRADRRQPLVSAPVLVEYRLACRHCLTAPPQELGDHNLVSNVVLTAICGANPVPGCASTEAFIATLDQARRLAHPAVVGPNAAALTARSTIPVLKARLDIPSMLDQDGGMRIGVEVGVQRGINLEHLMSYWDSAWVVFAVDPWIQQDHYADNANVDLAGQNAAMQSTIIKTQRFGSRVHLIRDLSMNAAPLFVDGMLDYVYLDARHDYKSVLEEMHAFWPKLRKGGILAGHDFLDAADAAANARSQNNWALMYNGTVHPQGLAVKGAVIDFAALVNRQVVVAYQDTEWPSWLIRK